MADITVLQDADRLTAIMKDGRFHKGPAPAPKAGAPAGAEDLLVTL